MFRRILLLPTHLFLGASAAPALCQPQRLIRVSGGSNNDKDFTDMGCLDSPGSDFEDWFMDELLEGGDLMDFVPPEEARILRSERR
jgi:hypothetical protein